MKYLKKITALLMTAVVVLTSVSFSEKTASAAQIDVSGTTLIKGSNWEFTDGHEYSAFSVNKDNAFVVDEAQYSMKLKTTDETELTIEEGDGGGYPQELKDADVDGIDIMEEWKWFKVSSNTSGKIRVRWSNLKIYQKNNNGDGYEWKNVDVVRTLFYTLYDGKTTAQAIKDDGSKVEINAYVGMGAGLTSTAFVGIRETRVQNDFYEAGTNQKAYLYTNVTLTDIDSGQYIAVKADKVSGEFVHETTKLLYGQDDGRSIYYYKKIINEQGGADCAAGFTFEGSGFDYTFGRVYRDETETEQPPTGEIQYLGTGQNMVRFKVPEPNKTVTDNSDYYVAGKPTPEKDVYMNHIKNAKQHWTYEVTQPIPTDIPSNFYFDSFGLYDNIDKCLTVDSAKVYYGMSGTSDERDVSDWFNIKVDKDNKVSAELKNPTKNADFYTEHSVYRLVIRVHLAGTENWDSLSDEQKTALEEKWDSHHGISQINHTFNLGNVSYTECDGTTSPSNETITIILVNPKPEKSVTDSDEIRTTENHCRNVMEHWTYRASQEIPMSAGNHGGYSRFELIDEIEECMQVNSVRVERVYTDRTTKRKTAGEDVSAWFDITAGNKVVAALKNPDYETNQKFYENSNYQTSDMSYELVIDVSLKGVENWDNMTDAEKTALEQKWKTHGHYNTTETTLTEFNTASRNIDGDVRTTNRTTTVIDLSTDSNGTPGLAITKDVNRYEHQVGDLAHYTVTVWNTNPKADTAGFKIWDTTLPDTMELDFSSVTVTGIDAANYVLTQSGNGWILKSKGTYALPYGTKIVITYDAKALIPSNGTLVDNTAKTTAIGIPEKSDSEQVYINSPKNIVVKTAPHTKYKVGDTVGYDVTITNFNPGTFMRNVVLTDVVDTPGLAIKEGSVAVLVGGRDVTSQVDVVFDDDGKGFTIKTPFNLYNGVLPVLTDACTNPDPYTSITHWTDKIKVTYDATITDEAALESSLKNTFTAPATPNTNGDVIRDDDTIPSGGGSDDEAIPLKTPALDVQKSSNKQSYKVGETGTYTLQVSQTKENLTAKNVVIKDTFINQDGMEIKAESIKVLFNGTDITADCEIAAGKTDFVIQTGKDLTDEDSLKVTYDVLFTKEGTYNNTVVASSNNTNDAQDDNSVDVTEITPRLRITKKSDKKEYKVGEYGLYTLEVEERVTGATAKNVVVEDAFMQKDGLATDTTSIEVLLNGADITAECEITANATNFTIKTGKNLTDKDLLAVTYKVQFTKKGTYDNMAVASSDNTEESEDDNEVVVKEIKPVLNIVKNSDKKTYQIGDTGKYTLIATQKVKDATAQNVVIEDSFATEKGIQVKRKTITVRFNGKNITKSCRIESDVTTFRIETGKNLNDKDVIKITYDVKYTAKGTYKNTAAVTADNAKKKNDTNIVYVRKPSKPTPPEPNHPKGTGFGIAPQTGGKILAFALPALVIAFAGILIFIFRKKVKDKEDEKK